ncbi:MAG: DUF4271 domain-containing protein [Bacteroidales bacterium]
MNMHLPQYYPSSFITIMLIVILIVFMSSYTKGNETFQNLFRRLVYRHATFSSNYVNLNASNHRRFILCMLVPCVVFLVVYQSCKLYFPSAFTIIDKNLLILLTLIVTIFIFRYLAYKFLGSISDNNEITNQFIELNLIAGQIYSIVSIPLLVVFFYSPPILKLISFVALALIMTGIMMVLIYRGLLFFILNKYPIFYFILYLCAVEILPAAFFAKWLLF